MADTSPDARQQFLSLLANRLPQPGWSRLLLGKYRGPEAELQRLTIRPLTLRNTAMLSFVYQYRTRDITQNHSLQEGLAHIHHLLGENFKTAHLFDGTQETQLEISKKGKPFLQRHTASGSAPPSRQHDRQKKRLVDLQRPYLQALGITDAQQQLIPSMSAKWKQINKFIEIFSQALDSSPLAGQTLLQVVDFGCGKGYLTFAIHDYLHQLNQNSAVTGVELRPPLVALCNDTASRLGYQDLTFVCGDVKTHAPQRCDVMIALHACDTATDYAMHYGIQAGASLILCAPCCHKQLRPQLHGPALLQPILQYGVHAGQQAEMLTDSLRALLLEAQGYHTKVFEFISLEHTDKNKMILAVKNPTACDPVAETKRRQQLFTQIAEIKQFYGITEQCLETLCLNTGRGPA